MGPAVFGEDDKMSPTFMERNTGDRKCYDQTLPNGTKLSKQSGELGLEAEHKRTRERFWALYMIGTEQSNATRWAQETGRNPRTVMEWVDCTTIKVRRR